MGTRTWDLEGGVGAMPFGRPWEMMGRCRAVSSGTPHRLERPCKGAAAILEDRWGLSVTVTVFWGGCDSAFGPLALVLWGTHSPNPLRLKPGLCGAGGTLVELWRGTELPEGRTAGGGGWWLVVAVLLIGSDVYVAPGVCEVVSTLNSSPGPHMTNPRT